jgi:hypothetical protein
MTRCPQDPSHLQVVIGHEEVGEKKDMGSFEEFVLGGILVYVLQKKREGFVRRAE